ncbi:MAG: glycosyltransferase [Thermodesulfobacteriota bacterium]
MREIFDTYTRTVLSFRLGDGGGVYATAPAAPAALDVIARQAARTGHCVLLGAGSGEAARVLAARLPQGVELTVCELYPEQARSFGEGLPLLADASPVALAWLLFSVGLYRGKAFCALNPEVADPKARARFQALQKLHAAFAHLEPGGDGPAQTLTVAAILHPGEPDLEGFFASLPACAGEAVVVWDGESPPDNPPPSPVPVRHLAHPLERDFAAQRNRMLSACRGDWVLYLDGDERLEPALAALLPHLVRQERADAFAFPRLALCPGGVRVGWGLWPDLQVRLFRRAPGVRFVRPVHERLEGLAGPTGLVVGASIRHLSGIIKAGVEIDRKLSLFDLAGGAGPVHMRNKEYPVLPESFFMGLSPGPVAGCWPETVSFAPL